MVLLHRLQPSTLPPNILKPHYQDRSILEPDSTEIKSGRGRFQVRKNNAVTSEAYVRLNHLPGILSNPQWQRARLAGLQLCSEQRLRNSAADPLYPIRSILAVDLYRINSSQLILLNDAIRILIA